MRNELRGMRRAIILSLGIFIVTLTASAFAPIPKESAKALKVTRGKPFVAGAVFINGKYIEPPYVVERWGTGIRINGNSVSGQIIDWNEFLKTQSSVKVTKTEAPQVPQPPPQEEKKSEPAAMEAVDDASLDSLFDDEPAPARPAAVSKRVVVSTPVAKPKPTAVTTYSMDGKFVPNDATKAMLNRINAVRTEIDRTIRAGGFICFGDTYSQVTGDSRTLLDLLEKIPEFQRNAKDEQDFCERVRAAGLVYLNEVLRLDLYRHRADYRKLQERCKKLKRDSEVQRMLDEVSAPLL